MRRILFVLAVLSSLLSACAPASPTIDVAQVQASAMAAASTMIAMTVAAFPPATPIPPTPPPSPTPLPLPTLPPVSTLPPAAQPTKAPSGGNCKGIFDVAASGPKAPILINNTTKGPVTFGMLLTTRNTFGQCGYIVAPPIPKGQSVGISVPLVHTSMGDSCYWAYAIVNDPQKPANPTGGPWCIDSQLKWTVNVSYDKIVLVTP
ncbi:MAG TPA: hypothetical protein VF784_07915 [Anaerolineales bacterium]